MDKPRIHDDSIRERAYSLWEAEGCPDGCADRHWQQAEAELFEGTEGQDMAEARNASSAELGESADTSDAPDVPGRSRRRA
ncbi:MAG: DUF2934 domain-containing protein [Pseudomonadota bacterium]|uniref:DUF2934 domain-containing protein n=1 Tax=Tabrizicola sp. TaxID=2005166 RepID=UPI0025EFC5FA|nr:DUF2934 domain-containing protein [Tabrizicola sp.]